MLSEALELIQQTANDAVAPRVIKNEFDHTKYFIQIGKELREVEAPLPVRDHRFLSLDDFIRMAHQAIADKYVPVIWHDNAQVLLLFDDLRRRDKGRFELVRSPQFKTLLDLGSKAFTQRELVYLLRTTYAECLDVDLLSLIRRINFQNRQSGSSAIQHGRESMDRSITAELTGSGELPEGITITCNVYQNLTEIGQIETEVTVPCAVEVDPDEQKFKILPFPGELDDNLRRVGASIREWLTSNSRGIAVYYGTP